MVSIQIGTGAILKGNFSTIDWSTGPYFIYTETDPDGGFDYRIIGSSELLSVPFALFAASAKSIFDSSYLSNRINAKMNINDTALMLSNYSKAGDFVKTSSLQGLDSFNINIKGNMGSSGNVTVAGNIEAFGTTSTLGTVDKPFKGLFISSGSLSIASDTLGQNIPAAILSNIGGNLEISAGGLKLNGTNEAFIAPRIVSTLTGNASTATKLENAKTINGVLFDGSNDILIPANTQNILSFNNVGTGDVSGVTFDGSVAKTISYNSIGAAPLAGSTLITTVGTLTTGAIPYTLLTGTIPIWDQSTTGNAATATKLSSSKTINGVAFDGSANILISTASANAITYTNTGTGDPAGGSYDGSLAKSISYNSIGAVGSNPAITGATKTKLTYDAKGLVTAGADATTADIAATTNKNYVTDAQVGVLSNTSGSNSGDESTATIKTKLGITTLSGDNTGDQVLPTLVSLGAVANNPAITGATKTKLTYDAKGLVTAGADATTADIAATTNKNYVTDAQVGVLSNTSGSNSGDETTATIKTKLGITTLSGDNTGDQVNITGNAATVTTNANLSGDISSVGNTTAIGLLKVTNSMIAASTIDVTSKIIGIVPIENGGTNTNATPTAGGINYGTGTAQAYTTAGTSGQLLQSNGTSAPSWVAQPGPGSVTILTSTTPASTYSVPVGVKAIMIELIGGGGGSGAIVATGGTNKGASSGGGASGTYTRKLIINPASSYVYTIGLGGTGGVTGGTGGTGGQTSFNAAAITAPGGLGGAGCGTATQYIISNGGNAGLAGIGDISVPGHAGGTGLVIVGMAICGTGANSFFGDGPLASATTGAKVGPNAATGYGAGAAGLAVYATAISGSNGTGADGFQGVIIVTEYK